MIATASPPQTRFCPKCRTEKPLDQFRRRVPGTEHRHPVCNACHAERERQRRLAVWLSAQRRKLRLAASRLAATELRQIDDRFQSVASSLGGRDAFARSVREFTTALREESRKSPGNWVLRELWLGIMWIELRWPKLHPVQAQQPDFDGMRDEKLKA